MKRLIQLNILIVFLLTILPNVNASERKCSQSEQVSNQVTVQVIDQVTSRSLEEPRQEIKIEEPVPTEISQRGIDFIKQYEGFIPVATRLTGEQYMTLGYRSLW